MGCHPSRPSSSSVDVSASDAHQPASVRIDQEIQPTHLAHWLRNGNWQGAVDVKFRNHDRMVGHLWVVSNDQRKVSIYLSAPSSSIQRSSMLVVRSSSRKRAWLVGMVDGRSLSMNMTLQSDGSVKLIMFMDGKKPGHMIIPSSSMQKLKHDKNFVIEK